MAGPFFFLSLLISAALYFGLGIETEPGIVQALVMFGGIAFVLYAVWRDIQKHLDHGARKD